MPLTIISVHMSNDLTLYERQMLQYWLRTKMILRKIAKTMRRTHSNLSKEINKNGCGDRIKYRADVAQRKYEQRQHKQRIGKLGKHPELKEYVESKLRLDWSPEQISGRLVKHPPAELEGITISHESIYYYVYEKSDKYKKLYKHLRTNRVKRKKWGKRKSTKICIPERTSIHQRPLVVGEKGRYGDWESDSMIFSKQREILSVQFERKSQLVRINRVKNKTAEETKHALIKMAESLPDRELLKTITFDNGTEGVKHVDIKELYNIETYFCDSYCSWQKGGVENANKLIRQYLPRKTNMYKLTQDDVYKIQERLNSRPRKGLNYQTPNEVIHKVVPS